MKKDLLNQGMAMADDELGMAMENENSPEAVVSESFNEEEDLDNEDEDLDDGEELDDDDTRADEETDEYYLEKMMEWLMPWAEKTSGLQEISDWEMNLPEIMMLKLLRLWLSDANRKRLDKVLHGYHPLDRAGMCYALLMFVMTGHRMHFKGILPEQHFKVLCDCIEADMPELFFADHLISNLMKFGKKHLYDDGRYSD